MAELEAKSSAAEIALEKVTLKAAKTGATLAGCEKTLAAMDDAKTDGVGARPLPCVCTMALVWAVQIFFLLCKTVLRKSQT